MKKILLVTISVIMVLFISGCNNKFTTEKWINCDNSKKYKYMEDFESNYNLLGMTSKEVKSLLGDPYCEKKSGDFDYDVYINNSETNMFYYYRIKDDMLKGWKIYLIEFDDDIVIHTSIGVEDW